MLKRISKSFILYAIGVAAIIITFAAMMSEHAETRRQLALHQQMGNAVMSFTIRECTESESDPLKGAGWSRMQDSDIRLALSEKMRGKAEIGGRPLTCRFWYKVNDKEVSFVEIKVDQLWWRSR